MSAKSEGESERQNFCRTAMVTIVTPSAQEPLKQGAALH